MPGRIQNNMKEVGLAFLMGLIVALGCIAAIGAINWGVAMEGILFIIAGVADLIISGFAGVLFYKRYLKPTES